MNVYRYTLTELPGVMIPLGKQGEDGRTRIEVDVSPWLAEHPGATIALTVTMSNGDQYAGAVEVVDGIAVWKITESDTILAGYGWAEWRMDCPSGDTYITRKARTHLYPQAGATNGNGNPYAPIAAQVQEAARQAKEAAGQAQESEQAAAASAELAKQAAANGGYIQFEIGDDGRLYMYRTENVTFVFEIEEGRLMMYEQV